MIENRIFDITMFQNVTLIFNLTKSPRKIYTDNKSDNTKLNSDNQMNYLIEQVSALLLSRMSESFLLTCVCV